jgi:iron(III) transport system substrate-binding protein
MKAAGAPVDAFNLDPTVARVDGIGLSASAPHPASALLYMDFLLGEGQAILGAREFFPTNVKAAKAVAGVHIVFSDAGKQIDEGERWSRLFNETFGRRAR